MPPHVKGVICAGGHATRLGELCSDKNKVMVDLYDRPILFHILRFFQNLNIREIMLITNPEHVGSIGERIGGGVVRARGTDEVLFDMDFTFRTQREAGGIAQAIGLAEGFIGPGERLVVCLGDNVIEGNVYADYQRYLRQAEGAMIFLKQVSDPGDFGVPRFEDGRIVEIIEKPGNRQYPELNPKIEPPSDLAVIGIYMYDFSVFGKISKLKPSGRDEVEVTDLNQAYADEGTLSYGILDGWWSDVGNRDSLLETAQLVRRTGANNIVHLPTSRRRSSSRRTSAG